MRLRGALFARAAALGIAVLLLLAAAALAAPPAGPPYPDPVENQAVYDYAGIFSPHAIASAEATIDAIEARTGAEVAVYTQVKPQSDTIEAANQDAVDLMNEWGVGRKGFDDGLVILFDMEGNLIHGQVSLYAGAGFKAAYLTNADRQTIFDKDMLPLLKSQDFDGALAIALADIDAAATPEHASQLNFARQLNAVVGIGTLMLSIWLIAFVVVTWFTKGRDPAYTDDDSVLMPAPPPGLTPAMATLLMDDRTSSRTVSAAFVDLAARGLIRFYQEGSGKNSFGIGVRNAAVPLPHPEQWLWEGLSRRGPIPTSVLWFKLRHPRSTPAGFVGADGVPADQTLARYIDPASMRTLASPISVFKTSLEKSSVDNRWLSGEPTKVLVKWLVLAVVMFVGAGILVFWSVQLDASGGLLGAIGLGTAGVITAGLAFLMPSRTMTGSMLRAQLLAYKRSMKATLAMAGSMDEVVEKRVLPWVETPDAAMAWGVALGLNDEIDAVLRRTVDASVASGRSAGWYPGWWVGGYSSGGQGFSGVSGAAGTAGLYSSSMVPDVGGMMSALGSIGSSTSSSSGGGGGFGGGGGGGGGGAGGGF